MKRFHLPHFTKRTKILISLFGLPLMLILPVGWFFVALFVYFYVLQIDTKYLGMLAIALLISIPIFQYVHLDDRAEQMAVYVYYLLCGIVAIQILSPSDHNDTE